MRKIYGSRNGKDHRQHGFYGTYNDIAMTYGHFCDGKTHIYFNDSFNPIFLMSTNILVGA